MTDIVTPLCAVCRKPVSRMVWRLRANRDVLARVCCHGVVATAVFSPSPFRATPRPTRELARGGVLHVSFSTE